MTGTWDPGLVSRFDRVRSSRLAVFVTTDRGRLAQTAGRSVLSDDVVGGGQLVESLPTTHPCTLETVSVTEKMNLAEPETHNSVGRTRGIAIFTESAKRVALQNRAIFRTFLCNPVETRH